ncbi:MAG: glutathione S-transferase family protein [Hyphomicrobiales bacterium]
MAHTLYACLGSGNCFKTWLAMQQLGLAFDFEAIDVLSGEQKSADYLAVNPLGVVPYLVPEKGEGIGESNAMLWYLAEGTHLMPATQMERAKALQWMFFEQSKLEPFISPARFFTTILPAARQERAAEIAAWQASAKPGLARLNEHLSDNEFVLSCGYSIADIALFGYTHVVEEADIALKDYPAIARWIESVKATQGFQPLASMRPDAPALAA